ncbi:MAG: hypothetical protein LBS21_01315 [Clostridiales bacterium]|jgi:hypothetical protein|nr:hypothetical protein [Clostridiales bacterium]
MIKDAGFSKSITGLSQTADNTAVWECFKNESKENRYYPRRRVNYNVSKDIFEIDMDACLHKNDSFMGKLYKEFRLDNRNTILIAGENTNKNSSNYLSEGHYRCHLCYS